MNTESHVREFVHKVVDKADIVKLKAILDLLDEEYFTPEEIAEIHELSASDDWTDWREVRRDV
jgi:hypothetical protein